MRQTLPVPGGISQELWGARDRLFLCGPATEERGQRQLLQGRGRAGGPPPATTLRRLQKSPEVGRQVLPLLHQPGLGPWACRRPPQCCQLQRGHVKLPLSLFPPRGLNSHRLTPEAWAGPAGRERLALGGCWDQPTLGHNRQLGAAWGRGLDFTLRHGVPQGRRGGGTGWTCESKLVEGGPQPPGMLCPLRHGSHRVPGGPCCALQVVWLTAYLTPPQNDK